MDVVALAAWHLLLVLSLIGWGSTLRRLVQMPAPDNRWGVDMLLGCAAVVGIGGVAIAFGLGGGPAWTVLLVVGAILAVHQLTREDRLRSLRPERPRDAAVTAVTGLILFAVSLGNMLDRPWSRWDDEPSYFYFTRRLWELGDLHDIYNTRRLQSHGATSFLQTLGYGPLTENAFNSFDEMIGAALLFSFVLLVKGTARKIWASVLVTTIVTFHYSHGSGNSTTVLFFTATYAVVIHEVFSSWDSEPRQRGALVQIQMIVIMLLTMMRPFAGAVLALFVIWQLTAGGLLRHRWLSFRSATAILIVGIPWMYLQFRDDRTPFYPIFPGVSSSVFPIAGDRSKVDIGQYMIKSTVELMTSGTIPWLGAACLLFWLLRRRPSRGNLLSSSQAAYLALIIAVCGYVLLFAFTTPRGGTPLTWTRYWSPFVVGMGTAPVMLTMRHDWRARSWHRALPAAQALLVFGGFLVLPHTLVLEIGRDAIGLASGDYARRFSDDRFAKYNSQYAEIKSFIAPGSTVLSAVQLPHLLIDPGITLFTVDFALAAAPHGEFPSKGTFDDQRAWLSVQPVDFLVVHTRDADSVLYGYEVWTDGLKTTEKADSDISEYMLEWLDFTYELIDSTEPVVISGDLVLISVERLR